MGEIDYQSIPYALCTFKELLDGLKLEEQLSLQDLQEMVSTEEKIKTLTHLYKVERRIAWIEKRLPLKNSLH